MERYDTPTATRRLQRSLDQAKEVMRYSDIMSVHLDKWKTVDKDGKPCSRFTTSIRSTCDENWYDDEEED